MLARADTRILNNPFSKTIFNRLQTNKTFRKVISISFVFTSIISSKCSFSLAIICHYCVYLDTTIKQMYIEYSKYMDRSWHAMYEEHGTCYVQSNALQLPIDVGFTIILIEIVGQPLVTRIVAMVIEFWSESPSRWRRNISPRKSYQFQNYMFCRR